MYTIKPDKGKDPVDIISTMQHIYIAKTMQVQADVL